MEKLRQFAGGEYYFKIPAHWKCEVRSWSTLFELFEPNFRPELTFYLDMEEVSELPSDIFNILFDLAAAAAKAKVKLLFTGTVPEIEERVSLLVHSSE